MNDELMKQIDEWHKAEKHQEIIDALDIIAFFFISLSSLIFYKSFLHRIIFFSSKVTSHTKIMATTDSSRIGAKTPAPSS